MICLSHVTTFYQSCDHFLSVPASPASTPQIDHLQSHDRSAQKSQCRYISRATEHASISHRTERARSHSRMTERAVISRATVRAYISHTTTRASISYTTARARISHTSETRDRSLSICRMTELARSHDRRWVNGDTTVTRLIEHSQSLVT